MPTAGLEHFLCLVNALIWNDYEVTFEQQVMIVKIHVLKADFISILVLYGKFENPIRLPNHLLRCDISYFNPPHRMSVKYLMNEGQL